MVTSLESAAQKARELRLADLLETAGPAFEMVSFSSLGDRVVLEGCVESYGRKAKAERIALEAGFSSVENCIRVAPGVAPRPTA